MFRYTPAPFQNVRIVDSFWSERLRVNHERSLPKQYEMCERSGRFEALKLNWQPGWPNRPHIFWDSDTAKWLEAACYACRIREDAELRAKIDRVARLFVEAQQPDGYLNSYFSQIDQDRRWKNLRFNHELYCAGHIFEAAVAHYELTGEDFFLKAACRYADYIASVFGREEGKLPGYCGHEEIKLALVKLARVTGDKRYLDLASYFLEQRGRQPLYFQVEQQGAVPLDFQGHGFVDSYVQADVPVRDMTEALGHSVRAVYYYCAIADLARAQEDPTLFSTAERLWKNVTGKKMFVTGGIGSNWVGEAFSTDYDLPNERAYCETCASVGLIFWAHRMLQHSGEADYAAVIERALYNGALAGMSLDGESFFYQNPLASFGEHHRQSWFECSCCPSNLSRLLATLGTYVYSTGPGEVRVHQYLGSEAELTLPQGEKIELRQRGGAPWVGELELEIAATGGQEWRLSLRVPDWARNFQVALNGQEISGQLEKGYVSIRRAWTPGDSVAVRFESPVLRIRSHPRVVGNSGQVALQRGPFVYCIEDADFSASVLNVRLPSSEDLSPQRDEDLLHGAVTLVGAGEAFPAEGEALYRFASEQGFKKIPFRAIPYFAWNNRTPGAMRVWIPER